jgi:tRNA(Arg) A34 adenosine deaminase TadA
MPAKNILNTAIKYALQSEEDYRVAAVLYKGGAILRCAANSIKFIGYRKNIFPFEPTRHAEVSVIHNMPRDVSAKCSLLVVRVSKEGTLVSAKPCKACFEAIQQACISKLYYSNYEGDIIKINPLKVNIEEWKKETIPNI